MTVQTLAVPASSRRKRRSDRASDRASAALFKLVHTRNLVYNTCWEDPRLDRQALALGPDDNVLVITSAGCNALDYVLQAPRSVHAVDVNPRQNALLELKIAGIRNLDHSRFFRLFGEGRLDGFERVYRDALRDELSPFARRYWDRRAWFFTERSRGGSFYYHGTAGLFAWLINSYVNRIGALRIGIADLLAAQSVAEQRAIFDEHRMREAFWTPLVRWVLRRDAALAMLGVPRAQRRQLDWHYEGGLLHFVRDRLETVLTKIPLLDNYFWRVYLTGRYTPECCPEYLKRHNFDRLKEGLIERIVVHTNTVQGFLETTAESFSRYVLLDHMDWMAEVNPGALAAEWQAIVDRADRSCRILWRSAGFRVDFVDSIVVRWNRETCPVGELLRYDDVLATELHARDRVHTYGAFQIADLTLPASAA